MAKHHFLVSPFGELNLRVLADHVHLEASDQLAGDWGLGWWHAHQAGDAAVFERSFWKGTLGAEPKPSVGRTEVDAFVRQWAFDADLPQETSSLPAGLRSRVHAYAQGFNHARHRKSKEAPWNADDCHQLARTLGFLEWWETRAPQIAFLIEAWQNGLAWEKIQDLWPQLGPEPDPAPWKGLVLPAPFSAEARGFVNRVRRFRPGPVWTIPAGRSASGRALLGACYVTDVTEPGLPFLPVRIDTPTGSVRGLSRPGHPGLLSGRTGWLAWHVAPAVDDTVDWRLVSGGREPSLVAAWAGAGKTGTLESLLTLEESPSVEQARERTVHLGSACLDYAAVDSQGGCDRWSQGPRWQRREPRDAWLPASLTLDIPTTERRGPTTAGWLGGNRVSLAELESRLASTRSELPEQALPALRFLLPDSDRGQRLRRWTGTPPTGPEAEEFERLYTSVLESFWESSPLVPEPTSPEAQTLAPIIDGLILAPHSAWLPSHEKNHRLAEAVRRAFGPGRPRGTALLGRRAAKPCWTEMHGGRPRTFASTVIVVADPGETTWKVFHTDDETEVPGFIVW